MVVYDKYYVKNKKNKTKQKKNKKKIDQQKSICADCESKKYTFLKTSKKQKIVFTNYKAWIFIAKTVKNTLNVHIHRRIF